MSVTREEVKAMISALAAFVRSEDSTMEFRLISPAVYKPVKNFAGIIDSMTHGMYNDIYSLVELTEEPCWEKKWSEQFGSWEKEIG